ncbi:MAG: type II toxin-antitoxin system VapC family toxin [Candidatus Hermodarchaeota archaeon]
MKFLDTSFLLDIIRKHSPAESLLDQLDKEGPHATSTLVVHEFLVGAYGAKEPIKELSVREKLLQKLIILPFDLTSAKESAKLEVQLREQGQYIGGADILIAGTMLAKNITTIVTKNVKHFNAIPSLKIETY